MSTMYLERNFFYQSRTTLIEPRVSDYVCAELGPMHLYVHYVRLPILEQGTIQ